MSRNGGGSKERQCTALGNSRSQVHVRQFNSEQLQE